MKIQKKNRGGGPGVWGVDVKEELKFFVKIRGGRGWSGDRVGGGQGGCERRIKVFVKIQKKIGGVGGSGGGSGWWGGWVRVDVNAMLGVGGDVVYGGWEPRVEGIVQGTKRYCTILRN